MKVWIPFALLTLSALAGCADDAATTDDEEGPDFEDVNVSSDKGIIRGVVIDASITPVADAEVQVRGTDLTATTGPEGTFQFGNVDPGSHFLDVRKTGFLPAQTSVDVTAGEKDPKILKVQLLVDEQFQPDRVTIQYDGFLQCSFTLVVVGLNACGLGEIIGVPLDNPLVVHDIKGNGTFAQTEMIWDSTQPLGDALSLMYSWGRCGDFFCDVGASGPSPLVLNVEEEQLNTMLDDPADSSQPGLMVRVFGTESDQAQGTGLGATLDQRFTHYTSVFWGFTPDEGWLFSVDGEHPLPE